MATCYMGSLAIVILLSLPPLIDIIHEKLFTDEKSPAEENYVHGAYWVVILALVGYLWWLSNINVTCAEGDADCKELSKLEDMINKFCTGGDVK